MKKLNYQLKELCKANREGSYATQSDRFKVLQLIANQLYKLGYRQMELHTLKSKHVIALVENWHAQGISSGTLKNRLSYLRWWARKINKQNVVAKSNEAYVVPPRKSVSDENKARTLDQDKLQKVDDPYVKMSLQLQRNFGLRREEAIKFIPHYADRGDHILLKPSWTKGGKARSIPITTAEQREILEQAKKLVGKGSLIPPHLTYIQQRGIYEKQTAKAGLHKMHGLRHGFAQQRYQALTGWACPACGGVSVRRLSDEQRQKDKEIRLMISKELGHERLDIVAIYVGR